MPRSAVGTWSRNSCHSAGKNRPAWTVSQSMSSAVPVLTRAERRRRPHGRGDARRRSGREPIPTTARTRSSARCRGARAAARCRRRGGPCRCSPSARPPRWRAACCARPPAGRTTRRDAAAGRSCGGLRGCSPSPGRRAGRRPACPPGCRPARSRGRGRRRRRGGSTANGSGGGSVTRPVWTLARRGRRHAQLAADAHDADWAAKRPCSVPSAAQIGRNGAQAAQIGRGGEIGR